jgi:hypothetical protein
VSWHVEMWECDTCGRIALYQRGNDVDDTKPCGAVTGEYGTGAPQYWCPGLLEFLTTHDFD